MNDALCVHSGGVWLLVWKYQVYRLITLYMCSHNDYQDEIQSSNSGTVLVCSCSLLSVWIYDHFQSPPAVC